MVVLIIKIILGLMTIGIVGVGLLYALSLNSFHKYVEYCDKHDLDWKDDSNSNKWKEGKLK